MPDMTSRCIEAFRSRYGDVPPSAVRAPGRVNLIGEHTDYNEGFVLPIGIAQGITLVGASRAGTEMRVYSLDFAREVCIDLGKPFAPREERWGIYVEGAARALFEETGHAAQGFDAVFSGDIPQGSGLSSSAALEVATAFFLDAAFGLNVPLERLAQICQKAENVYVGVQCGIMDQFASCLCAKDRALFLDCRDLSYRQAPFVLNGLELLILDTTVSRGLVDSEYNDRRAACERGAAIFGGFLPGVKALRDVTPSQFEANKTALPEEIRARCAHVVSEDDRVIRSVEVLARGDMRAFGDLMNASHRSLRDDYQVTCRELDVLHDAALKLPGCVGERMTGAGFGGCAIALVESGARAAFVEELTRVYREETGRLLKWYAARPENGVHRL